MGKKSTKSIRVSKNVLTNFRVAMLQKYGTLHSIAYNEWNQALSDRIQVMKEQLKKKDFSNDYDLDPLREHDTAITIRIDEDIIKEFRMLVVKKHGKSRGYMYKELNMALNERAKKLIGDSEGTVIL